MDEEATLAKYFFAICSGRLPPPDCWQLPPGEVKVGHPIDGIERLSPPECQDERVAPLEKHRLGVCRGSTQSGPGSEPSPSL
jgi:hypothetical protein